LNSDPRALNLYGAAVFFAYDYLFDPAYDSIRNPYDPQFRRACDIYNSALEAGLRLIQKNGRLLPGESIVIDTGAERIKVSVVARGLWEPDCFERLEFVSDYEITGLKNKHHSFGLGVPMIAIRRAGSTNDPAEEYYLEELSCPVTAFLRIIPGPELGSQEGLPDRFQRHCVLELFDTVDCSTTVVANRLVPLETDLSTPLGYELEKGKERGSSAVATLGLLKPGATESYEGLYMIEPFDPRKIPVVMVHGLWSSPMTWMEMFNDLLAFPEIRQNYQFWFYLYSTGRPFWYAASQMRSDLAEMRQTLDPSGTNQAIDQMILVGHSMGGLVSTMQTIDSGDDFWNLLTDRPFDELRADPDVQREVAQAVFFQSNPSVQRVITIGTPHRGSRFANDYTRFLARKLIHLPSRVLWVTQQLVMENPGFFRDTDLLTISTSVDSLAPDSPILPTMLEAKRAPWVRFHNIAGIVDEKPPFWKWYWEEGDGVVSYESARREDFDSEIVVNADHVSVHNHPRSILEVRRILLEHLAVSRHPGQDAAPAAFPRQGEREPSGSGVVPVTTQFPHPPVPHR